MKKRYTLLVILALCYSASVFAQKNTVVLGLFYLPVCDAHIGHVSLSYYQTFKPKQLIGIKSMLTTDMIGKSAGDIRTYTINTDLVHSWRFRSKTNRSTFLLDAGISMLSIFERIPPDAAPREYSVGITEEIFGTQEEFHAATYTNATFRAGIATAAQMHCPVSRNLGFEIGLVMNFYYSPEQTCLLLLMPNLGVVYSF